MISSDFHYAGFRMVYLTLVETDHQYLIDSDNGFDDVNSTFDRVVKVLAQGASLFGGVGSISTECIFTLHTIKLIQQFNQHFPVGYRIINN